METKTNPLLVFQQEAPEVSRAFDGLINALQSTTGLDAKTKHLVYIGIKTALDDKTAVYFHGPMAKRLGATREEIRDTILVTLSVCGLRGVANCLQPALEIYDDTI